MSFGEQVRRELLERPPRRRCCQAALLSGLVRQSGVLELHGGGELSVRAELAEPAAARLAFRLLRALGGESEILSYPEQRFARPPHIGAHAAALDFVAGEALADTRARVNRLTNCDRANLVRASAAAHRQLEAI